MSTKQIQQNLWQVDFPMQGLGFSHVWLRRETYENFPYELLRPECRVIIVDLSKFIAMIENNDPEYVVSEFNTWAAEKQLGIIEFMRPNEISDFQGNGSVLMPVVGHHHRKEIDPMPWWKFRSPRLTRTIEYASFANGRHRTRFLQYAGAADMPIEVDPSSVDWYMRTCGISIER